MTSHTSHSVTAVTVTDGPPLPHLYRPAEVAEALGVSEWWVKEQARKGRIPFTRLGGGYRFTADHYAEIISVFEERPRRASAPAPEPVPAQVPRRLKASLAGATRLRSKSPRRAKPAFAAA
ncbi:helix-turn-helix domain-containing protein [Streptomyces sp. NBC_01456]|uniref:helix-turn-helix domain-containing protein n=1 Tax=unclassified Streptomyces TaxID=2593676 RepID=UPI002E34B393|nr:MULTISPECIES: helix-turn-helix domain-containing protein [unclassified Streptomyces]